jgi:hypothetical protein
MYVILQIRKLLTCANSFKNTRMLHMSEIINRDYLLNGLGLGGRLLMFNPMDLLVIARSVAYAAY